MALLRWTQECRGQCAALVQRGRRGRGGLRRLLEHWSCSCRRILKLCLRGWWIGGCCCIRRRLGSGAWQRLLVCWLCGTNRDSLSSCWMCWCWLVASFSAWLATVPRFGNGTRVAHSSASWHLAWRFQLRGHRHSGRWRSCLGAIRSALSNGGLADAGFLSAVAVIGVEWRMCGMTMRTWAFGGLFCWR
jgi:hypothetical protein